MIPLWTIPRQYFQPNFVRPIHERHAYSTDLNMSLYTYGDDIAIVVNDGDIHRAATSMQNYLSTRETWLVKCKVSVNEEKSHLIISLKKIDNIHLSAHR